MTESSFPQDPRYNAVKHGLTARRLLLREEEAAEFAAFRDGWFREWCPRGHGECAAVYEMAEAQWRLLRCAPIEAELMESLRHPDAPAGGLAAAFLGGKDADGSDLLRLARYRRAIERSYDRALRDLLLLHRARGVWSRPEIPQAESEPTDWIEAVPAHWRAGVAHAVAMPPREDEDEVTWSVERLILGPDGKDYPPDEYERRERAGEFAPYLHSEAEPPPPAADASAAASGSSQAGIGLAPVAPPEAVRPKADILQNGPGTNVDHKGVEPETSGNPAGSGTRLRR